MTDFSREALINQLNIFIPFLVRLLGVEPRTSWSVAKRSIQLSYRRILILFNYNILIFSIFLLKDKFKIL